MKEIKVNIDNDLYDKTKELNIDIEAFLNSKLQSRVREISNEIAFEKLIQDIRDNENKGNIIKIIKRISKGSKFNYASRDCIIAEAEIQDIWKEEVEETLDILLRDKIIYEPAKMNYRITRKSL